MNPRDLLWHPEERRIRAVWRLLLLAVFVVVAAIVTGTVAYVAGFEVGNPAVVRPPVPRVLGVLTFGAGMVGAVWLGGRLLDRRWFRDFGLHVDRAWVLDLGFGLALGAGMPTLVFLAELAAGWVTVAGTLHAAPEAGSFWPAFGAVVVVFLAVGFYEELLVRGYLLRNAAEGLTFFDALPARNAVVVAGLASSLVFGVAHGFNPNATVASALGITAIAALLAAGYLLTGELAIPIGVHVTWNLFQGPVYGFPVSGETFGVSLVVVEQSGPAVLTGGTFGPEAGLVGVGAVLVGMAVLAWWVRLTRGAVEVDESLAVPVLRWRE